MSRKDESTPETPEALFTESTRARSHGYLRGPQQDVLRAYMKSEDAENIALELPTGTGKTAVGLLIADWRRRRSGEKAAYLALTNQLAHQVMEEGTRLGVSCADLTGDKAHRSKHEEGRYLDGSAVGVTTYSNLFNINPVIQASDVLVFDDAHSGEQHVVDMWSVEVDQESDPTVYEECLAAIRPLLSELAFRRLRDPSKYSVELCDFAGDAQCVTNLTAALDGASSGRIRFSWPQIRNCLPACAILASSRRIVIRPIIAPSQTHEPFASTKQRILMSATLGDPSDLMREYGLTTIVTLRAENPQWGHRYIFVPEMHATEDAATRAIAAVWEGLQPQRAVLLTPSGALLDRTYERLCDQMSEPPTRVSATDITDSLEAFTQTDGAILTVAGRYDGLDFPDDDCRLLIMAEAPTAISDLERHLRDYWRLGPLMRRRELTRMLQGLGRCTRSSTDYSIVFWIGQSLVNAAANTALLAGLPKDVAAEVRWGVAQSGLAGEDLDTIPNMALNLIRDEDWRAEANESLKTYQPKEANEPAAYNPESVAAEVRYSQAMWEQDFRRAHQIAHTIADQAQDAGYRAWWWYLASTAAVFAGNVDGQADCLRRAVACGVNSGWIREVADRRGTGQVASGDEFSNSEQIWKQLELLGWAGRKFRDYLDGMAGLIRQVEHKQFHEGVERLGACVGAITTRINEQGAPDVVWSFDDDKHVVFEAKTEKAADSKLSKNDVLQARGHVNWVRDKLARSVDSAEIVSVIVSPTATVDDPAGPHIEGIYCVTPDLLADAVDRVASLLSELRTEFNGWDFGEAMDSFSAKIRLNSFDLSGVLDTLTQTPLQKP